MPRLLRLGILGLLVIAASSASPSAQLASRPVPEWVKTLDAADRVAALKLDEVVAALRLQPGQTVADIGAGSGLLAGRLGQVVGPRGRVYAVEIDAGFFPEIMKRAQAAQVTNVLTVLGTFTDPALPARNIDVAVFHDVIHHVQDRGTYLKTLAGYIVPSGRIVVVDFEGGKGPHRADPALEVTRDQLTGWMRAAGFTQVEDVKLFPDKYMLAFARK